MAGDSKDIKILLLSGEAQALAIESYMLNTSPMQHHFARLCLNASGLRDSAI